MKNNLIKLHSSTRCVLMSIFGMLISFSAGAEYFRHITLGDGLSQPTVLSIAQDKLGRMWFGTKEGVNIYDGTSIRIFKGHIHTGGEKLWIGNSVGSIHEDAVGNMYMMIEKEIIKYELSSDSFSKLNYGAVTSLSGFKGEIGYPKGDSIMMIENNTGVARLELIVPSNIKGGHFSFDGENLYLTTKRGLHIFNRKTHKHTHLLPDKYVYSRCLAKDGTLWISTHSDGLYRYKMGDKEPKRVSLPISQTGVVNGTQSRKILEDQDGRIWYGSFNGLYCYDPYKDTTRRIEIPQNIGGLSHSSVLGMYCDRKEIYGLGHTMEV